MDNQQQDDESNAKIIILDSDGATIFKGRRTVRNVTNDGVVKSGCVIVKRQKYDVVHKNEEWTGPMYTLGLNLE